MPVNFSKDLKNNNMENTNSSTVSNEGSSIASDVPQEKFDVQKWIIAVTSIINNHSDRIHQLERSNLYLRIMVVVFLLAFTYIWR